MHYNAVFEARFWRKVHYSAVFGDGKRQEKLSTQRRRGAEKRFEGEQRREKIARCPRAYLKVAPTFFPLSPLLAHTSTTDRCKSFISIHIAKQGGVGGTSFFENGLWEVRVGDG